MLLIAIIGATLAAGIGSVWLAAMLLLLGMDGRWRIGPQHLLSLAAGALLSTAFMAVLPEAFEDHAAQPLFATLLLGLVLFFILEKAELWHHGHEHGAHGDAPHDHGHDHDHDHDHDWALIAGDSLHCFGDGVMIASTFVADWRLGLVAALSVLAHEVPHHVGDLVVLRQGKRRAALLKVSLAGAVTTLGGVAGYYIVGRWEAALPYFLVIAASSFIYVALADLIPQLQRRMSAAQAVVQILWLLGGMGAVMLVRSLAHHAH
ncbi:MAG: dihydroorotate dehydrogenase [Comamonas sp. SCN 65-56]|uniref:ZIP family metal transporter n=1 Tax=Comamonas sp. SCN 65-56 TaxID=1660095 RepID=UPI00086A5BEC|nr:ZIP family metal transporter [Comamonas sp. SCN 65-56]ODS92772.1 MAG: dihydroorotate dehydrogenase [Comamonas sp. SCN 65-56]